jgi:hypothetical protein
MRVLVVDWLKIGSYWPILAHYWLILEQKSEPIGFLAFGKSQIVRWAEMRSLALG